MARFRACWVTHAPVGFAVTPARCSRRVRCSMNTSTYRRFNVAVSTVKKSHAIIAGLGGQELPPSRPAPARCWIDPGDWA